MVESSSTSAMRRAMARLCQVVAPAKAGAQSWIPAFAGMTAAAVIFSPQLLATSSLSLPRGARAGARNEAAQSRAAQRERGHGKAQAGDRRFLRAGSERLCH